MNLFGDEITKDTNLLPRDGAVYYYGKIMSAAKTAYYFDSLMNTIEWKNDEAVIFGKHMITKRKVAWYGDREFEYSYSNIIKRALHWNKDLSELKALTEQLTREVFNSCLLNLYHNGEEGMTWHSDDEKELKKNGAIASLSFGAERKFSFKHKQNKDVVSIIMQPGSLLLMTDATQSHWLHRLPPAKRILKPRINLTFRTML